MSAGDFNPVIGDRFVLHTIDYINPGKEVIWDLSEVTIRSSNAVDIINPADSPFGNHFTDSDLCYDLGNGEYLYYAKNSNAYSALGGFSQGEILRNVNPKDLIRFPFKEGMSFKDEYSSTFKLKGVEFRREAEIECRIMGEGTAIFPFGIMDDVIKVRVTENIEDHYKVLGEQPAVLRSSKESYYFLKAGVNEIILTLNIVKQEGKEISRYGTLLDTGELSELLSMNAPIRAIHPKVDSTGAQLDVKLISEWTGELHISLKDLKGKDALDPIGMKVVPGSVRTSFDWSKLENGTYIMSLQLDDRLSQLKVMKE